MFQSTKIFLRPEVSKTCARGEGTKADKQGAYQHVHFFMMRRSATGLRAPKNGLQRAQKPAIWRPKRPPRHPKRHPKTGHKQTPRDPCLGGPKGGLPKTLLPLGLARETRPNLTTFGGFPLPHTPLVQISKAGPGRKLREAFVNTTGPCHSNLQTMTFRRPLPLVVPSIRAKPQAKQIATALEPLSDSPESTTSTGHSEVALAQLIRPLSIHLPDACSLSGLRAL